VQIERFVSGSPQGGIVRIAGERKPDLIVLGAYGHGAMSHMFFGSTTSRVVRQAGCPVLTIRA